MREVAVTGLDVPAPAGLLVAGVVYLRGYRSLAGRAHGIGRRHAVAFLAGLGALGVALLPPVASLSHVVFSVHMVQHLLLVAVAPVLLAAGRPAPVLWAAAAPPVRRRLRAVGRWTLAERTGRAARHPGLVVALAVAALWGWHAPGPYQAALGNGAVHAAEHVSLFVTASALWRLVLGSSARRRYGTALLSVFVSGLAGAALGALLTFSTTVLYPAYGDGPLRWGLTPLEDQQLAGSIMWVPPGFVTLVTMVALAHRWLGEAERVAGSRERRARPAGAGDPR